MSAKRVIALALFVGIFFVAAAPTSLAHDRRRRGVAARNYYNNDCRDRGSVGFYDGRFDRNGPGFYEGRRYRRGPGFNEGRRYRRNGLDSTGRAVLTVAAPAAIAAGVGALLDGKKGAAIGALLGGGGGAAYYLIRNRDRDRRWRR